MALAVAMVAVPCVHSAGTAPRLSFLQPQGGTRRAQGWTPLSVRSIATRPPKSSTEVEWKSKRETLKKNNLRSVKPKEALRLQQDEGYTILDVRPEAEYAEGHAAGAKNAQLYRLIKEWTPWDIARRAGFAFFGIFSGTEENPEFLNEVRALNLDKDARIILGCQSGGTMKPSPSLSDGQQSRSLIAAYVLTLNGYKNLLHIEGGFRTWFKEDLPAEGADL